MSTRERVAGAGEHSALDELRSLQIDRGTARGSRRARRRLPWGWLIALVVLAGAVYLLREPALRWYAEQTTPPPETAVVVKVGGAETVLSTSGYVNADQVVTVGSTIPGRLRSVLADKGDHVRRGQLLAQLEDDELRAELAVMQANLSRDEKNLARQEVLGRSGATPQEALDNARAQVQSDRANIQLIEARLKQTRIISTIDGKVLERLNQPGDIVTPTGSFGNGSTGNGIFKLADLRKTVVEVDVNETDIARLRLGQPADITLDAYPEHPYAGRLNEFAQIADKAKATVQVKVLFSNPDDNVRPGMSAKVLFRPAAGAATEPERLVMPRRALLPGGDAVYLVMDGRIERRAVAVRAGRDAESVDVVNGLADGDRVIVSGQDKLRPGQKVAKKD